MSMIKAHSLNMCLMRGGAAEGYVQKIEKFLSQLRQRNRLLLPHVSNAARLNDPFA